MALNVKAAMLICGGFISGLCWLVSQVALPVAAVPPRLLEGQPALLAALAPGVGVVAQARAPTAPLGVRPIFRHRSPFEPPVPDGHSETERVAVAGLPTTAEGARLAALPPLARRAANGQALAVETEAPVVLGGVLPKSSPLVVDGESAPPDESQAGRSADEARRAAVLIVVDAAQAGPAAGGAVPAPQRRRYKVRKGDTLMKIARGQLNSADARLVGLLIECNPKLRPRPDRVLVGEQLIIPEAALVQRFLRNGGRLQSEKKPPVLAQAGAARARRTKARERRTPQYYTIRARDSLTSIARRYLNDGRRWREIAEINGLRKPHRIIPGKRIRLPVTVAASNG